MKPVAEWVAIGREYRAGQLSVREIARQHGCSESAIRKAAKRCGWTRDLAARVREGVRARVAQQNGVYSGNGLTPAVSMAIDRGGSVLRSHQHLLGGLRHDIELIRGYLKDWLNGSAQERERACERIFLANSDGVAATLTALTASVERVIRLERQIYALDEDRSAEGDYERELEAARARVALEAARTRGASAGGGSPGPRHLRLMASTGTATPRWTSRVSGDRAL